MTRERPEEVEAAVAVAAALGGTYVPRDVPGAPEGTHDFDIHVGSRVIAMEVTSATDGPTTALWNVVSESDLLQPSLHYSWGLNLQPGTSIKRLVKGVTKPLELLERAEVLKFGFGHPGGRVTADVIEALTALDELGVRAGCAVDDPPSRIVVAVAGPGGWGGPDAFTEAVEREAVANAEKLYRSDTDERHLFLWVDWTRFDLQAAVLSVRNFGRMPAVPELPEGVDTVWVAPIAMVDESQTFLWRVTQLGGWEVLDPSVLWGGRGGTG